MTISSPTTANEKEAEKLLAEYSAFDGGGEWRNNYNKLRDLIAHALTAARRSALEEAAGIADGYRGEIRYWNTGNEIGAAIRARMEAK